MNTAVKCWLFSSVEHWNLTGAVGTPPQQPLGKIPRLGLGFIGAVTLRYEFSVRCVKGFSMQTASHVRWMKPQLHRAWRRVPT